jgi:hypothetical protein
MKYAIYILNDDGSLGELVGTCNGSDKQALEAAKALLKSTMVAEVWCRGRLVGTVGPTQRIPN